MTFNISENIYPLYIFPYKLHMNIIETVTIKTIFTIYYIFLNG